MVGNGRVRTDWVWMEREKTKIPSRFLDIT